MDIASYFRFMAASRPDETALIFEKHSFTYKELDIWSERIASALTGRIQTHQPVGVAMRRSPLWVAVMLGIWKAGGIYVPLDLGNPKRRMETIIKDCGISLVIKDDETDLMFSSVSTCTGNELSDAGIHPVVPVRVDENAFACIIYTSGTTGTPKGVGIKHRQAVVMGRLGRSRIFHIQPGSRMLQLAGLAYSASLVETMSCLLNGGCFVMANEEERHNPNSLFVLLERERVESAFIPPALLSQMPEGELPCLETLVVAGEGVASETRDYWMKGRRMVNAYGFTENTVLVTSGIYTSDTKVNDIGTPLPGVKAYILDEALNPVSPGTPGELCISGRQLADGYWRTLVQSDSRFVPNSFATEKEKRKGYDMLYRSGDKVMCQPNGHFLYLGRMDCQFKVRGIRMEAGEIEQCLNNYPEISASVVLLKEHQGKKKLVAYLQTDAEIDVKDITSYLQKRLPESMCPLKYVVMKEFPLTLNQKTDKSRLPEPDWTCMETAQTLPVTRTEKTIARIWSRMLNCGLVSREDDFIALGGDSISVMLMTDELEKAFGVRLEASDIYQRKGLVALAKFIDEKLTKKTSTFCLSDAEGYEPPAPLRNLLMDCLQSEDRNKAYKLAVFIPFEEKEFDILALQDAWNQIVREQDSLRIYFKRGDDGKYYVHTVPFRKKDIPVKEICKEDFLLDAEELYRQPLEPEHSPLHRECLYSLSDGTSILVLVIHHLITDGWSLRLLVHSLKELCRTGKNGSEPYKVLYSYRKYAWWYRQFLKKSVLKEKQAFWQSYMAGCPKLTLSRNCLTESPVGHQGFALSVPMNSRSTDALNRFVRSYSVTPFAVCLCVYQILLMKYSGQEDFAVGAAFTSRQSPELRGLMGYLTTLLPVRSLASGSVTFVSMVKQISRNILLLSDKSLPLDMITGNLGHDSGKAGGEDFLRFAFGLEEVPSPLDIPDEWTTSASFDLALSVYRKGRDYLYHYQYAADCFDASFLNTFSRSFDVALLFLTSHPEERISACPLLPEEKIGEMVRGFRFADMSRHLPDVVTRFERVAQECPDRTACVWNGIRTTYGELLIQSSRIASAVCHRLASIAIGSTPMAVGVRMEEKRYMLPILLGILKSGNSYVPLDAAMPEERLTFILKDADVRLLLCDTPFHVRNCNMLTVGDAMADTVEKTMVEAAIRPENTAYIIYTSGTTGKPKGTPIRHGALSLFADSQSKLFQLQPGVPVLQYSSIAFDASVLEIFPTLLSQATLVVPTEEERKDGDLLLELLEREKVRCALIPPALLSLLPFRRLPHLKILAVGGESTPEAVMRKWSDGRIFLNEYGPTENTVVTTCSEYTEGCQSDNIGKPLPGVSCYVVDKDLNLMPDGVPGELCIGGLQLTEGYLHREVLTKEKFVENPFVLPEDKACGVNTLLYHSGDKVLRNADGSFRYLGRMDSQIKLRGFRIELDEIARHLEQYPDILQALAVLKEAGNGRSYIVAYVVTKTDRSTLYEELYSYLRNCLPTYMIPTAWCTVEGFPMTLNGKINKAALPEPSWLTTDAHVQPANREETILSDVAGNILEMDQVGVTTDLFDLGLTSLQVIELVCDAHKQGVSLTATDIYKGRYIRNILSGRKGDFFWQGNRGMNGKPLMVLLGYPAFSPYYDAFVELFKDDYDFFVLESFADTLQGKHDCDADGLVSYYHKVITQELSGKNVSVIAGYCLGGELAMLLAEKLRTERWPQVRALVIDGFLFRNKEMPLFDLDVDGAGSERDKVIAEILQSLPQPVFGGEMAVCLTLRPYRFRTRNGVVLDMDEIQRRNRENWKRIYSHALFCEVDADHNSVFEKKYMAEFYEAVKRYWLTNKITKTDDNEK